MATSGSIDFSLNARDVITFTLRKLRAIGSGETASAAQADDARRELNLMLKGWQKYDNLWRLAEGTVTLVADTASYALSPVPHKVVSIRYRNTDGTDQLFDPILSRQDYYGLSSLTSEGTPNSAYIDYQRTAATLYIWPVINSVTTETLVYTYFRKFEDVDSLDNDIDVKQDWLEVVGYNLAARMGPDYGRVGGAAFAEIQRMAKELLEEALDEDREDFVQFTPMYAGWPS